MKKKVLIPVAILFILLLALSCSSKEISGSFPYGSYSYRSYNFLGDLVGEGSLCISEADSNTFTGNWQIREVRKCLNCGAQFGGGFLTGYVENDSMYINLNPEITEIDTRLIGVVANGVYRGDWRWTNQAGFGFSGTFEAERH